VTDDLPILRRRLLAVAASGGVASLAGCNSLSESSNTSEQEDTTSTTSESSNTSEQKDTTSTTVVFTESTTSTSTTAPTTSTADSEQVFSGGTLADFQDALRAASELPNAALQIDPGTYQFDPLREVSNGNKRAHARFTEIEDVTIEGNGATFVFSNPLRAGLRFNGGRDVTVRNLTLDYDPVPFTQGEIIDLGSDRRRITLALDHRYPSLSHSMFESADRVWASVHQPDGSLVEGYRKEGSFDKFFSSIDRVADRRFELTLQDGVNSNGLAEGRRLTVVARNQGTVLAFYQMEQPTVEDVTVRASGGAVFSAAVCSDPVFRGTTIVPPSDSDRQIASDADGIRIINCLSSTTIEDCHHERLLDDSIVVQHTFTSVTEILDDRTVAVENVHPFVVNSEDTLEALSQSGVRLGELPPIEDYERRFSSPGNRHKPSTITFREPISNTLSVGDYVGNQATGSQNFTVRNNELRDHRGILVRVVARHGEIRNNVLDGASRNPIELECDNDRHFAPKGYVDNVTVAENTIRRAGMVYFAGDEPAGIRAHLLTRRDVPDEGRPNRNIKLLDNEIETTAGVGIDVENAGNVEIFGNQISNVNQLGYGPYGVSVADSQDVTLTDNTVEGTSNRLQAFGQRSGSREITSSKNTFRVDEEVRTVTLQQWLPVAFKFNRAVQPEPNSRYLTVRCYRLRLSNGDATIQEYNIGVDESGLRLKRGYFSPETADSGTWRWFGGGDAVTRLTLPADVIEQAEQLEIQSMPIEQDIEATVSVDGNDGETIQFASERRQWYTFDIPDR
jgi:LysM repeat protein